MNFSRFNSKRKIRTRNDINFALTASLYSAVLYQEWHENQNETAGSNSVQSEHTNKHTRGKTCSNSFTDP